MTEVAYETEHDIVVPGHEDHSGHHEGLPGTIGHVSPVKSLVVVLLCLLTLTVITVAVAQVNLGLDSQDCDLGILLMLEAGYPFRLTEFRIRRDPILLESIYAKFDRVRAAIAANEPPRHCCAPDSTEMKKCPARGHCWMKELA